MQNNSGFIKLSLANVKCLVRLCSMPITNKLIKLLLFLFLFFWCGFEYSKKEKEKGKQKTEMQR